MPDLLHAGRGSGFFIRQAGGMKGGLLDDGDDDGDDDDAILVPNAHLSREGKEKLSTIAIGTDVARYTLNSKISVNQP